MYPKYKWKLGTDGTLNDAFPIWNNSLAKVFEKDSNQMYFRQKLNGKITFVGADYTYITGLAFDTRFDVVLLISYDNGTSWNTYWQGVFYKTDCQFNNDNKTCVVTPSVNDAYAAVLEGIEREYDLITLAPEIIRIKADKRPIVQVYVPGQTVIGCFLSGMWWEQSCNAAGEYDLENTYHFARCAQQSFITITSTAQFVDGEYMSTTPTDTNEYMRFYYYDSVAQVTRQYRYYRWTTGDDPVVYHERWQIWAMYTDEPQMLYSTARDDGSGYYNNPVPPNPLNPVPGSGAIGTATASDYQTISVWCRLLLDKSTVGSNTATLLPDNDIVDDNRNYHYVYPYAMNNSVYFSVRFSSTPTEYGMYQPGQYYVKPYVYGAELAPVARNAWSRFSVWYTPDPIYTQLIEQQARTQFTIRDAYPISSVISVLLAKIAPDLTHDDTTEYSQFLYGTNPISGVRLNLAITPKSNIITSGYDQPAQQSPITLKMVMEMLRDCFRCYWFIDDSGRFCIEHVRYFNDGRSYTGRPSYDYEYDLTSEKVSRTGKSWATGQNEFSFDKPDMAGRYQFSWMDEVTQLFKGYPMDIVSGYVTKEKIEEIIVSDFTSDIDYILLNPGAISMDGYVLLGARYQNGEYVLPYDVYDNVTLQNADVAFCFLQQYYAYDMPARNYTINGVSKYALGVKKLKTQSVKFPMLTDPDLYGIIITGLGRGVIQKITLNLSSRNANTTLVYDPE